MSRLGVGATRQATMRLLDGVEDEITRFDDVVIHENNDPCLIT